MNLAVVDGVAEYTQTSGTTRPYILSGAVAGYLSFAEALSDEDELNFYIFDGARFERGVGRYRILSATIDTIRLTSSSNFGNPVVWPTSGHRIIRLEVAAASYLLNMQDTLWRMIDTAVLTDLGTATDQAAVAHDMGRLSGSLSDIADDTLDSVDLGRGTTPGSFSRIDTIDRIFWASLDTALLTDLGTMSDQAMRGYDAGSLSGTVTNAASASIFAIDLGRGTGWIRSATSDDIFWTIFEMSVGVDLGRLANGSASAHDMGALSGSLTNYRSASTNSVDLGSSIA